MVSNGIIQPARLESSHLVEDVEIRGERVTSRGLCAIVRHQNGVIKVNEIRLRQRGVLNLRHLD